MRHAPTLTTPNPSPRVNERESRALLHFDETANLQDIAEAQAVVPTDRSAALAMDDSEERNERASRTALFRAKQQRPGRVGAGVPRRPFQERG
jgi:hypothetical protein